MKFSLQLALILDLFFVCIGGLEETTFDSLNDTVSTDGFPTSETIFPINATLNEGENVKTTAAEYESVSASDRAEDDVIRLGHVDDREENDVCGSPRVIEHARLLERKSPPYVIGTSLSYSCEFGYSADKATHVSTCSQSSANSKPTWSDPLIVCNPRGCGDPGFVANAERIGSQFTFSNSVSFECDEGYKLSGPNIRYCQVNGRWTGTLPTCEKIICDAPEKPENGGVLFSSLEYGSSLKYTCDLGFILKNDNSRTCSENGTWSGIEPLCKEAKCDVPVAPENGFVEMVGGIPRIDSIALYSCEEGRKLVGSPISKCLDTGEWTFPTPKCLRPCSVPYISNGIVGKYELSWNHRWQFKTLEPETEIQDGEELILRCDEKYEPLGKKKGEEKVFCAKREWKEIPACKPAKCRNSPPPTENARIIRADKEHGGGVVYYCKKYFQKSKKGNVTCHFGTWIGMTPVCVDERCYVDKMGFPGLKKDLKNMYIDKQEFKPSCVKGYKVSDPENTFVCEAGVWKGNFPPCTVAGCSEPPPSIEHGYIKTYNGLHSSFVEYVCNDSYVMTSSRVQCLFGEWKGTPPICKDTVCYFRDLKIKEGIVSPSKDPTENGENLQVQCASGYHKVYFGHLCSRGEWGEAHRSPCEEDSCSVHRIQNGAITNRTSKTRITWKGRVTEYNFEKVRIGKEIDVGESLYVTCLQGFSFQGQNLNDVKTTCTRGTWKPTPVCLIPGASYEEESEDNTVDHRNSSSENTEDVISHTFSTPLTTSADMLTKVHVSEDLESIEDCFCVYSGSEDLIAYADNQFLASGDKVTLNSVVKFHCTYTGYYRLIGNRELVCNRCEPWDRSEYPRCESPSRGDAIVVFDQQFHVSPGGVLTVDQGLNVVLRCSAANIMAYPSWFLPFPHKDIETFGVYDARNHNPYFGQLLINNTSPIHNGEYSCALQGYRKTSLQIKVKARCKVFEERDDLIVAYDQGQTVNSSVSFTCRDRRKKLAGLGVLTCLENGQWSGQPPRCTSHCKMLEERDDLIVAYDQGQTVNSSVSFTCRDRRAKLAGLRVLTCLENGQWSGQPPRCTYLDCPDLQATENLAIIYSDGLKLGSTAHFHCHVPFERKGALSLRCLQNGEWSGNVPTCTLPMCSLEELYYLLPETVTVDLKEETDPNLPYGFEVNLTCDGNMRLKTPATAKCGRDRKWEVPATNCVLGCAPVQILPGSQMIVEPAKDFYMFGESVVLSCAPGQVLNSEVEVLMCLRKGWSEDEIPFCKYSDSKET